MNFEFKVFTLNCWGIPVISSDRFTRMKAIADVLANSNYDVVCLQEVWTDRDYFLIRDKLAESLPFSHYFYSGVTGSGLCIFSKHAIQETFFHQWCLNGYIHKLQHGDWYGGKGVGLCKLSVQNFNINIYSAHLHAEYNRHSHEYEAHRILQAYDTAQFIKFTSEGADLVVLAGDLNAEEGDLAYRLMLSVPGLLDAFKESKDSTKTAIATCESLQNSYTASSLIKRNVPGIRIDHIMYHPGSKLQVTLKNYAQPLPNRVPGYDCSFSDHEAIESTLFLSKRKIPLPAFDFDERNSVLEDCLKVLNKSLDSLKVHKTIYLMFSLLMLLVLIGSLFLDIPYGYHILINILRTVITILMVFFTMMATIWNNIEKHGVLAGKLAIEILSMMILLSISYYFLLMLHLQAKSST